MIDYAMNLIITEFEDLYTDELEILVRTALQLIGERFLSLNEADRFDYLVDIINSKLGNY